MYIHNIVVGMERDGSKKNPLNGTGFFELLLTQKRIASLRLKFDISYLFI